MNFSKQIRENVEVDGYGDVEFTGPGGYYGEEISIAFTIEELLEIAQEAKEFKSQYDAYVANGYEDVE